MSVGLRPIDGGDNLHSCISSFQLKAADGSLLMQRPAIEGDEENAELVFVAARHGAGDQTLGLILLTHTGCTLCENKWSFELASAPNAVPERIPGHMKVVLELPIVLHVRCGELGMLVTVLEQQAVVAGASRLHQQHGHRQHASSMQRALMQRSSSVAM
jgi:hypothetical protein